jgi:hypothetical protein
MGCLPVTLNYRTDIWILVILFVILFSKVVEIVVTVIPEVIRNLH